MEIQLDTNYRIVSDANNIMLEGKRIGKSGKSEGKEIWETLGYYSNVNNCLKGYLNERIKTSNAKSVNELIELIQQVESDLNIINI